MGDLLFGFQCVFRVEGWAAALRTIDISRISTESGAWELGGIAGEGDEAFAAIGNFWCVDRDCIADWLSIALVRSLALCRSFWKGALRALDQCGCLQPSVVRNRQ